MNKNFKVQAQGGFTLIELIVVIVILGILAATALPKFANLSGDARVASLSAAKGAIASSAAIVHGKILVNPGAVTSNTLVVEGNNVKVANGYPDGTANGAVLVAGIDTAKDYTLLTKDSADPKPTIPTDGFALVPAGAANPDKCYLTYAPATKDATSGAITPPAIVLANTATAANCE
ncbi:type II secretion system protein [Massilia aerilata]|uniref:Type II secretion system protein n=1 Tax=Massilia aerilata TaxID=453817 RepID=A0ABW0RV54_9BURK